MYVPTTLVIQTRMQGLCSVLPSRDGGLPTLSYACLSVFWFIFSTLLLCHTQTHIDFWHLEHTHFWPPAHCLILPSPCLLIILPILSSPQFFLSFSASVFSSLSGITPSFFSILYSFHLSFSIYFWLPLISVLLSFLFIVPVCFSSSPALTPPYCLSSPFPPVYPPILPFVVGEPSGLPFVSSSSIHCKWLSLASVAHTASGSFIILFYSVNKAAVSHKKATHSLQCYYN